MYIEHGLETAVTVLCIPCIYDVALKEEEVVYFTFYKQG